MKITRNLCSAALLLTLTACATQEKYKQKLDSWLGASAQSLVNQWGYPDSQMTAPDGNTVYIYHRSGSMTLPTTTTTNATVNAYGNAAYGHATSVTSGGQTIEFNCSTFFEIGSANTVVSWHYQGNSCRSR